MKKSDLRSGMLVTLRNNNAYYVMLNTGLPSDHADVLVRKVGHDTGWMSLRYYDEDMTYHDNPNDIFSPTPEEDRMWDIMKVESTDAPGHICMRHYYRTVWERKE